jgi:putative ABC transport system permease protein
MFKNYLKIAYRSLSKNKVYTFINILGLALGLTITILVFLFIKDEKSYDKHWDGSDRIYRTGITAVMMGQTIDGPISPSPMAQALRAEFTDVESATRFNPVTQEIMVRNEQTKIYVQKGVYADSTFFKVFSYNFIQGSAENALKDENAMVLTAEVAKKLFGSENAVGKIVNYDNRRDYIVKGVVEQPESHSHFKFDMFMSQNNIDQYWTSNNFKTYFKLKEGVTISDFEPKMVANFMKKVEPEVEQFMKISMEDLQEQGDSFKYFTQSIQDIHLHSNKNYEIQQNGNIMYIYVFFGIAILVILIAGINFMNLSTARSGKRAKEVGVRKVSGASKKMLITQFLLESVIQSLIALFVAFILVELFIPGFNNIMETQITLFNENLSQTILFSFLITLFYGLFAGSYPAFFLSSFEPVRVLKGDFTKTKGGALLRKSLVVFQFTASAILIIGMMVIFSQISYLHNKDIGFEGEQVITVPLQTDQLADNFRTYKKVFEKNSNVLSVSRSGYLPGDNPNQSMYTIEGRGDDPIPLWYLDVDFDFFKTLGVELIEGRVFNMEQDSDSIPTFIVNETALKTLKLDNPLNERLGTFINREGGMAYGNIVGVVKDFHIEGFNQAIRPMVMRINNYTWFASFKVAPNDIQSTIAYIEKEWNKLEPTHPFRYTFLDEKFGALLKQQESFGTMFLFLTILAIIISAMGLYGLSSYTAEQRTKEIGVRKVLGSSVGQIMKMLTTDFLKLVLIANIFSWPITYILAKNWLNNFSYQIDMPILPFVFATLLSMIIALITVSSQAYIAANSDPVNALKYE